MFEAGELTVDPKLGAIIELRQLCPSYHGADCSVLGSDPVERICLCDDGLGDVLALIDLLGNWFQYGCFDVL